MFNPHLKISTNEIPGPYDVPGEFFRITKEEIIPLLHEFFQRIEKEETIPSTFYEASVTSITKPHKDSNKKGNSRPVSLMKIDSKSLNKILPGRIEQFI